MVKSRDIQVQINMVKDMYKKGFPNLKLRNLYNNLVLKDLNRGLWFQVLIQINHFSNSFPYSIL